MFEKQIVMLRSTFSGAPKSLVEWRKCSTFAVEFAKNFSEAKWAPVAPKEYTLL
jgi:hypothetical protein